MQFLNGWESLFDVLAAREFSLRLTFTLLHFLWQGVAIAAAVAGAAWAARTAGPRVRYAITLTGLAALAICMPVTYFVVDVPPLQSASVVRGTEASALPLMATAPEHINPVSQTEEVLPANNPPLADIADIAPADVTFPAVAPAASHNAPPVSAAETEANFPIEVAYVIACLYSAGVCVMLVRLGVALAGTQLFRTSNRLMTDSRLLEQVAQQAQRLGLTAVPVVAYCERIVVPTVVGVIRPLVLLPVSAATGLDQTQLLAIISHELAHIRRWDLLVNFLQRLVESLLFFHPAVWLISRQVSYERELCCDDLVIQSGCESARYADALIRVAEIYSASVRPSLTPKLAALQATGMQRSELARRVHRLLGARDTPRFGSWRSVLLTTMLLLAGVATMALIPRGGTAVVQAAEGKKELAAANAQKNQKSDSSRKTVNTTTDEKTDPQPPPEMVSVRGAVVDADDSPVAGVRVFSYWYTGEQTVETDAQGQFELTIPRERVRGRTIRAYADSETRQAFHRLPWDANELESISEIRLQLAPARRIELHAADGEGRPIANAIAGVLADNGVVEHRVTDAAGKALILIPPEVTVNYVFALADNHGLDYRAYVLPRGRSQDQNAKPPVLGDEPVQLVLDGTQPLTVSLVEDDQTPIEGVTVYPWLVKKPDQPQDLNLSYVTNLVRQPTDADGKVVFRWIPHWQERSMTIWPSSDVYARHRGKYDPKTDGGSLTMTLDRLVPMRGRVTRSDGSPAEGATVAASGHGHFIDSFRAEAKTDADGRYEIMAAPNMLYLVTARIDHDHLAAPPQTNFAVWPQQPLDGIDFRLQPATRIFGRVTMGAANRPVENQSIIVYQYGGGPYHNKHIKLPNPDNNTFAVHPTLFHRTSTDPAGNFVLYLGPGNYDIRGPQQAKVEKFELTDEKEKEFSYHVDRPEKGMLSGRVIAESNGQPLPEAEVYGIPRHQFPGDIQATTDEAGEFKVERALHATVLHAKSKDGKLAAVVEIGPDAKTVTIPLTPLITARGRLIDDETGEPLPGREIRYGVNIHLGDEDAPFRTSFGGTTTTDDEGRFTLDQLVLGQTFRITVVTKRDNDGYASGWRGAGEVTPETAQQIELGDLNLKPPYRPPTMDERIAREFNRDETPQSRFESTRQNAQLSRQHVLILFGDPQGETARQFVELRYEDADVRRALDPYYRLMLNTTSEHRSAAADLAKQLDVPFPDGPNPFRLVLTDADGKLLATSAADELSVEGKIDKDKVIQWLNKHALEPLDAQQLLDEALTQAKQENKRVIVQETATWCGPCWMLSRFLNKNRNLWEKDYLWVKMDHRWTGSKEIMEKFRDGADGGVPWWAILDSDGNKLITSNRSNGDNIGFPSEESGKKHFRKMLEATAIRMNESEIDQLIEAISEND